MGEESDFQVLIHENAQEVLAILMRAESRFCEVRVWTLDPSGLRYE